MRITGTWELLFAAATVYQDGAVTAFIEGNLITQDATELTIENVVCNSAVCFYGYGAVIPVASSDNAEITMSGGIALAKITAPAGGTATITTYDDD